MSKVAVLITFPEHITEKQAKDFMNEWCGDLVKDGNEIVFDEEVFVKTLDPKMGCPIIVQIPNR